MKKIILFSGIILLNFYSVFSQCTSSLNSTNILCFNECTGSITATGSGGVAPYTYLWSTQDTVQTINNLCAGSYTVTVTDANNCTHVNTATVTQPTQLVATVTTINVSCPGSCTGSATINVSGGTPPYTYNWFNGTNIGPTNPTLCAGSYTVTVMDANACTIFLSFIITESFVMAVYIDNIQPSTCGQSNGSMSAYVVGGSAPYAYMWNNGATASSISNLSPGYYYVTVVDVNGCTNIASAFITDSVSAACQNVITGVTFQDLNNDGQRDLGEPVMPYSVIRFLPGPYYFSTDANGEFIAHVDTGTYTLDIPNPPQYYVQSSVNPVLTIAGPADTISNVNIGLHPIDVEDLQVNLYPYTNARPGFNVMYALVYKNPGTVAMSGEVKLLHDPVLNIVSIDPVNDSMSGDTLIWQFSNLSPLDQQNITIEYHLNSSVSIGTMLTSFAYITPIAGDSTPQNNQVVSTQIVTGSYDPNDKSVNPEMITPEMISNNEPLVYTIRFQNTGTDTAFTVIITDTLSSNLDIPTFQMLASSHPCTYRIFDSGIVEFKFENILLADSNINEPRSHGFVQFSVQAKPSLLLGESIDNFADIYFDFNIPVRTNTANTTVSDLLSVSVGINTETLQLRVSPNPFNNLVRVEFELNVSSFVTLDVYDVLGNKIETVFSGYLKHGNHGILLGDKLINAGLYILKLNATGNCTFSKVMKYN